MKYYYVENIGLFSCETEISSENFTPITEDEYNTKVAQAVKNRQVSEVVYDDSESVWDGT